MAFAVFATFCSKHCDKQKDKQQKVTDTRDGMLRAVDKWLWGYLRSVMDRPRDCPRPRHLLFGVADHFEPFRGGRAPAEALAGVTAWLRDYTRQFDGFRDADGRPPRHTFFYPADEYDGPCLGTLADFCAAGWGEVEIHLHHRYDTAEDLRRRLNECRGLLRAEHGLLGADRDGQVRYGFVHGNWALCNSRPDGDWCGVNEELGVLAETGCYADFTFPSAPSPTQPRMVNAIYRACDRPGRPRGHDRGKRVQVEGGRWKVEGGGEEAEQRPTFNIQHATLNGQTPGLQQDPASSSPPPPSTVHPPPCTDGVRSPLLLIQGPLGLDWGRRKWGLLPRLENAELSGVNPPSGRRADLWARQYVHVVGRPEWVFVKVHTHGCAGANRAALLGEPMVSLHRHLADRYNDGQEWLLHYVTAREMYNLVRAAESGVPGAPGGRRDFAIAPPPAVRDR